MSGLRSTILRKPRRTKGVRLLLVCACASVLVSMVVPAKAKTRLSRLVLNFLSFGDWSHPSPLMEQRAGETVG